MKRMKVLMLAMLITLSLCACGGNSGDATDTSSEKEQMTENTEAADDTEVTEGTEGTEITETTEESENVEGTESTENTENTENIVGENTENAECQHNYKSVVTKAATCTEDGVQTYKCTKCDDSYTETISKKGHAFVAATCTSPKHCSNCNVTEGDKLAHNYVNGVCACGYVTFYNGSGHWEMQIFCNEVDYHVRLRADSNNEGSFSFTGYELLYQREHFAGLTPEEQKDIIEAGSWEGNYDGSSIFYGNIHQHDSVYYYTNGYFGAGGWDFSYSEDGDVIRIQGSKNVIKIKRTGAKQYTITESTDPDAKKGIVLNWVSDN